MSSLTETDDHLEFHGGLCGLFCYLLTTSNLIHRVLGVHERSGVTRNKTRRLSFLSCDCENVEDNWDRNNGATLQDSIKHRGGMFLCCVLFFTTLHRCKYSL